MDTDLDTLATALYVKVDDLLKANPGRAPQRPAIGLKPQVSDAELITLSVMQVLLRYDDEARWVRHARAYLRGMFPVIPQQPGYNKRLRRLAATMTWLIRQVGQDTSIWSDDVWIADSTPIECARSRETVRRSDLAGWAEYGYCASHSRYFWGLRLHVVATVHGLPVMFALTGAKADERQVLHDLLAAEPGLLAARQNQTLMADKNYYGKTFEQELEDAGLNLLRPARKGEPARAGHRYFKPFRQIIESVFDTGKDQLGLERHHGKTPQGVATRIAQRMLALTAVIWHNDHTGQPIKRSLIAYDH